MHALIVGSTGLIGKQLIQILLEDPDYTKVTSLVRRPSGITHLKLSEVQVDFENLAAGTRDLAEGVDHYFCCMGTTIKIAGSQEKFRRVDFDYVVESAKLALDKGARTCSLVSSLGANAKSPIFYTRTKGEVENALMEMGFPSCLVYRPSFLTGEREGERAGEGVLVDKLSFLMIGPLASMRPISDLTVARVMAQKVKSPDAASAILESKEIQREFDAY